MRAEFINPFLEAATLVIEQVANVRPVMGRLSLLQEMPFHREYVWIHIGMQGHLTGNIIFGFPEKVAIKMASAMMGGFELTELNEIGQSAISELGNMISGNASTLLFNRGLQVDITPPRLVQNAAEIISPMNGVLSVPLIVDGIGQMEMQVVLLG